MAKHIYKGSGVPAFVPLQVGHHYIDTINKVQYVSVGTSLISDWKAFPSEGSINHANIQNIGTNTHAQIDSHISNIANPHSTTKAQLNLGSVDNTSDLSKPVSNPQQLALNAKVSGPSASVDSELPLFSGTLGNTIKRAVGSGIVRLTNGIVSLTGINLSSDASGILPEANGGTGISQANTVLFSGFDTVFNTPDGIETTAVSKNILHNSTNAHQQNGNVIRFYASGTIGGGLSTTKRLRVFWGAFVAYNSGTIANGSAGFWYLEGVIMRTGLNTQKIMTRVITSASIGFNDAQHYTAGEFTDSGASTLRICITGSNVDTVSLEMYKISREP